jgi:hypothetical protein
VKHSLELGLLFVPVLAAPKHAVRRSRIDSDGNRTVSV